MDYPVITEAAWLEHLHALEGRTRLVLDTDIYNEIDDQFGAITNIASALLIDPRIIERIVVIRLGRYARHWPHTVFVRQDPIYRDLFRKLEGPSPES